MIEVECRDRDRNKDRQLNQRREDIINMIYDRYEDDEQYQKNIKLDISNFDDRLDLQYYLDWVMSLERYFKWYEMSQEWRVRFYCYETAGRSGTILIKYWKADSTKETRTDLNLGWDEGQVEPEGPPNYFSGSTIRQTE